MRIFSYEKIHDGGNDTIGKQLKALKMELSDHEKR